MYLGHNNGCANLELNYKTLYIIHKKTMIRADSVIISFVFNGLQNVNTQNLSARSNYKWALFVQVGIKLHVYKKQFLDLYEFLTKK